MSNTKGEKTKEEIIKIEPVNNKAHAEEEYDETVANRVKRQWGSSQIFDFAVWAFIVIAAGILFNFLLDQLTALRDAIGTIIKILSPIIVGFVMAYVLSPVVYWLEKIILKWLDARDAKIREKMKKGSKAEREKERKEYEEKAAKIAKKEAARLAYEGDSANILDRRHRNARWASIAITMLLVLTLVVLLFIAVIPAVIDSVTMLANNVPVYHQALLNFVDKVVSGNSWLSKNIPDTNTLMETFNVNKKIEQLANDLLEQAGNWIVVAIRAIYNIIVGLIVAVYLLAGKERYLGQLKKLAFAIMKPKKAKNFIQTMNKSNVIFMKSILGKIFDSIIIGLICYIVMMIFGLFGLRVLGNNAVLVSVIVGITNIIPYFGPFIGAVPSVLLVLCEDLPQAVVLAALILVIQQFDSNYLTPKIVGKSVGLSPFYVIISCLVGGGLLGVVGMILGIPVGAIIYGFVKTSLEGRLENRSLPTETKEYALKPGAVILEEAAEKAKQAEEDELDLE